MRKKLVWAAGGLMAAVALNVPWLSSYAGGDVAVTVCGSDVLASSMNPVHVWGLMPATLVAVFPHGVDNMKVVGYSTVDMNGRWGIVKFTSSQDFTNKLAEDSPGQWTGPGEERALLIAVQQITPSATRAHIDSFDVIFRGPLGIPYWQRIDGSMSITDSCAT